MRIEIARSRLKMMLVWQTIRTSAFGRHSHGESYAALVLAGKYEEAGDHGRFQVEAGNVVFHDCFEAHLNRFSEAGATVLNFRLPAGCPHRPGIARVAEADRVVCIAERSCTEALHLLCSTAVHWTPRWIDWPDELAATLIRNPSLGLSRWGAQNGLAPWRVSRGFAQVFGISPESFRARMRARLALHLIQHTREPLASIAAELGFADQPHMTRGVRQLSGMAPQAWRSAANGFKTRWDPSG